MSAAIELTGISKRFFARGGDVLALDDLTLSVPRGGVFGLLGPNGAGKSTLLRIVAGLVRADSGSVRLLGEPANTASRARIGALIDSPVFYPFLSGHDLLVMLARTAGVRVHPLPLLRRVGLEGAANRSIAGYSLGMKQRLGIAAALLTSPELVILDEPTNGLDPEGMLEVRGLLRDLADREGVTVLLSSHLLDEVERLCDRVAIISHGRLAAAGEVAELLRGEQLLIDATPVEAVLARLGPNGARHGTGVAAQIAREDAPALIAALVADGVAIHEARWLRPDLEAIFLERTRGAA